MVLLQTYDFFEKPENSPILVGIFISILVLFLFLYIFNRLRNPDPNKRLYTRAGFRRSCRKVGLRKEHISLLEGLAKENGYKNPYRIIDDPDLLEGFLGRAFHNVQDGSMDEGQYQDILYNLFFIKKVTENFYIKRAIKKNANNFHLKMKLFLEWNGERYPASVVRVSHRRLYVTFPQDNLGHYIKIKKKAKLTVYFHHIENSLLLFRTRVKGYSKTGGAPSLILKRPRKVHPHHYRKMKRRAINLSISMAPVIYPKGLKGKKKGVRAVTLENKRHNAQLKNISMGGCAITSQYQYKRGDLVHVSFRLSGNTVIEFTARVRQARKKDREWILNLSFSKITKYGLNKIGEFIYRLSK